MAFLCLEFGADDIDRAMNDVFGGEMFAIASEVKTPRVG